MMDDAVSPTTGQPTGVLTPARGAGPSLQRHPKTLLEHAPEGMAAVDGKLMRENDMVKAGFEACLKVGAPPCLGAPKGPACIAHV